VMVGSGKEQVWERLPAPAEGGRGGGGAKTADIIMVLVPDELQGGMYKRTSRRTSRGRVPRLRPWLNIHFGQIVPGEDITCSWRRRRAWSSRPFQYVKGEGVPGLIAVHQDRRAGPRHGAAMRLPSAAPGQASSRLVPRGDRDGLFGEQAVAVRRCDGVDPGRL